MTTPERTKQSLKMPRESYVSYESYWFILSLPSRCQTNQRCALTTMAASWSCSVVCWNSGTAKLCDSSAKSHSTLQRHGKFWNKPMKMDRWTDGPLQLDIGCVGCVGCVYCNCARRGLSKPRFALRQRSKFNRPNSLSGLSQGYLAVGHGTGDCRGSEFLGHLNWSKLRQWSQEKVFERKKIAWTWLFA